MTATTNRSRPNGPHITNGKPRPGGRLARFITNQDPALHPIFEDGLVYVSVEGQGPRRAILDRLDFLRITARDPNGAWLTRTRWWLDDLGFLRAMSLHERPMQHGILVAAAVLGAKEGDTIEMPSDPFDLRLPQLERV